MMKRPWFGPKISWKKRKSGKEQLNKPKPPKSKGGGKGSGNSS